MTDSHPTTAQPSDAHALVQFIRDTIPLAAQMQLALDRHDGDRLRLALPLAPNVNDKGCAFGGSLVSAMTVAGWGLVELRLRALGLSCDVFVGDSQVRYLAPVWNDFCCEARLGEGAAWKDFFDTLQARGKARIDVRCRVPHDDDDAADAATLTARFVAKRRTPE